MRVRYDSGNDIYVPCAEKMTKTSSEAMMGCVTDENTNVEQDLETNTKRFLLWN